MSKKTDELPNEQEQKKQPAHVEELIKNGKVVLEAPTTEALAEMVNDILPIAATASVPSGIRQKAPTFCKLILSSN